MSEFLPIFLRIVDQPCLLVGGGEVALRKVRQLLRAKAQIEVMAPNLCLELDELSRAGQINHLEQEFSEDSLTKRYRLIIAATDSKEINKIISKFAQNNQIPVNVVDNPELCSFIMPSIVNREPIQIAISTGGASPVLARLLRARLETLIPPAYGQLAGLMQEFRAQAKSRFVELKARRRFWEGILQGPIAEMLFAGQTKAAKQALQQQLSSSTDGVDKSGEVYLVGGGPGDPDLLTFRALRLMQQADVVLYDRLVSPAIVDLVRKDAKHIYVGKQRDSHTVPQEEINQTLVELARQGNRVLRLKGGDPFIFGRGGEEIETLAAEGISFQVVPGITAAAGCASYAGIPLTHRDYAHTCIFVTGHMKDGQLDLNWQALVQPKQTIAVYMGLKGLDVLAEKLIQQGLSAETPVAIVQQGTTPDQKIFTTTISALSTLKDSTTIKPPSMIIIGEVVALHEKLAWYAPVIQDENK